MGEANPKTKREERQPSILDDLPFSREIGLFFISIFVIATLGQVVGQKQGADITKFITFNYSGNKYALIRDYTDKKIAVKIFDNKLTKDYIFLEKGNNLEFNISKINH